MFVHTVVSVQIQAHSDCPDFSSDQLMHKFGSGAKLSFSESDKHGSVQTFPADPERNLGRVGGNRNDMVSFP